MEKEQDRERKSEKDWERERNSDLRRILRLPTSLPLFRACWTQVEIWCWEKFNWLTAKSSMTAPPSKFLPPTSASAQGGSWPWLWNNRRRKKNMISWKITKLVCYSGKATRNDVRSNFGGVCQTLGEAAAISSCPEASREGCTTLLVRSCPSGCSWWRWWWCMMIVLHFELDLDEDWPYK